MKSATDYIVFISYSRTDWAVASLLSGYIRAAGVTCLVDRSFLAAGDQFSPKIIANIRTAHEVVVILSPRFKESRWLDIEVGAALGSGALVVPLLLNCAPGEVADLEVMRNAHAIMMDEYEAYLEQLRGRVAEFRTHPSIEQLVRIQQELQLELDKMRKA